MAIYTFQNISSETKASFLLFYGINGISLVRGEQAQLRSKQEANWLKLKIERRYLGTHQNDPSKKLSRVGSFPGLPSLFWAKSWVARSYAIKIGLNFRPEFLLDRI